MDAGEIWSSSRNAWISALGSAMLFRDYGYRILPSFSQMFWLGPPVDTLDCMMRVGVPDTYDPSWQDGHWRAESHGLSRSSMFLDERRVVPSDVRIMAASEMLMDTQRLASEKTKVYETLFVYGAHSIRGQRIILDLELDMDVPDEITVSVDIDSYIWVTSDFCPALNLGIYLAPVIDHQAPIHKHNHIYVDILIPQSAEDQGPDDTEIKEWWTKSVPLSSIPHVPFGMLSTMNHNCTNSSLKATRIPLDVIDLFWNKVVLPSISQEAPHSSLPYKRWLWPIWKSKTQGHPYPQSHRSSNVGSISYGSFFFVSEGKGIKLWTKDGQDDRYDTLYEALKKNFTNLNWDYMMDRKHGELYLDVGLSFNPTDGYLKECQWMHEIYSEGASKRAYGCRDKYRMSGQAALKVLPHLKEQLYEIQTYSLDSFQHLVWPHGCQAGGLETCSEISEEKIKEDNAQIHKIMGANIKSRPKSLALQNSTTISPDWPVGPQPSWKDVVQMIQDNPQLLMRPWVYNPIWDPGDLDVGMLFIQFTREFWLQLGSVMICRKPWPAGPWIG
ncbi:hypothetical protein BD769DRAFT_1384276 [Suillus cothurnatus]|nr:hypothetical protein BD769DRAFT_1384276 [Suillus cothurnatus]